MKLFKITDDCVHMHVLAMSASDALNIDGVADYFDEEEYEVCALNPDDEIVITFGDSIKIKHTVREWEYIYDGCGAMIMSTSEY